VADLKKDDKDSLSGGCILAHCMGLGKSLTTICFVEVLLNDPVLRQCRVKEDAMDIHCREYYGSDDEDDDNTNRYPSDSMLQGSADSVEGKGDSEDSVESVEGGPPKSSTKLGEPAKPHFRDRPKIKTILISTPKNVHQNWLDEFERFRPEIDVHYLGNSREDRLDVLRYWKRHGGVLLLTHEMVRNLTGTVGNSIKRRSDPTDNCARVSQKSQRVELQGKLLWSADVVIVDEGHLLRSKTSGVSRAMKSFVSKRRVVLTGSPMQNHLLEYYNMVDFVKPGLLGSEAHFKVRFVEPIQLGTSYNVSKKNKKRAQARIQILRRKLGGVIDRKDVSPLAAELKGKREVVLALKLTQEQLQCSIDLFRHFKNSGQIEMRSRGILHYIHHFFRIWAHPFLYHKLRERANKQIKSIASSSAPAGEADVIRAMTGVLNPEGRKWENNRDSDDEDSYSSEVSSESDQDDEDDDDERGDDESEDAKSGETVKRVIDRNPNLSAKMVNSF
jgi:hypothetical protein